MNTKETADTPSADLSFSLLWPEGRKTKAMQIHPQSALDLDLQKLIEFMAFDSKHVEALGAIIRSLFQDAETINYRLDIIAELVRFPELVRCIRSLLPVLRDLKYYETFLALEWKTSLQEAIWRLRELGHYVECVQKLGEAFEGIRGELRSRALKEFVNINSRVFTHLYEDFLFYPGALKLIDTMKACGLPIARPGSVHERLRLHPDPLPGAGKTGKRHGPFRRRS